MGLVTSRPERESSDAIRARVIAAHYLEEIGPDKAMRLADEIQRALEAVRHEHFIALDSDDLSGGAA